jgi:small ligand-binding sensory domain FIST
MILTTALQSANEATPDLVRSATRRALEKAGLNSAQGVLLFMTPEFSQNAQAAVTAAAQAAQCTTVFGGLAAGVLTEEGWTLDRPAAAVMVFGGRASLQPPDPENGQPILSYSGAWGRPQDAATSSGRVKRFGGAFSGEFSENPVQPAVWQCGRLLSPPHASTQIGGARVEISVSHGLLLVTQPTRIEGASGLILERLSNPPLGSQAAFKSLLRHFPIQAPLHQLMALVAKAPEDFSAFPDGDYRILPLISVNADHSITLAGETQAGEYLCWARRDRWNVPKDMRRAVDRVAAVVSEPVGALMFSCIGRGPFFYDRDDMDLKILRERFPGIPIIGCYGTGQIVPKSDPAEGFSYARNSVVTALLAPSGI